MKPPPPGNGTAWKGEIFYYRLDPLYASLAVFVAAFVCLLLCALFRPAANAPLWRRFLRPGGFSPAWLLGAAGDRRAGGGPGHPRAHHHEVPGGQHV